MFKEYTQKTMAELFGKNIKTISKHLTKIFESGELVKSEVTFNPNNWLQFKCIFECVIKDNDIILTLRQKIGLEDIIRMVKKRRLWWW